MNTIYLDNAATTRPSKAVIEAMNLAMENAWYNPSARYAPAASVHRMITEARRSVAASLGVRDDEIYFNSGGTEGDCHAIIGSMGTRRDKEIIVSSIEHSAVYETCKALEESGVAVKWIRPDPDGRISAEKVLNAISPDTRLVSIMHVNNETGAVNDIAGISKKVKEINPRIIFHSDGVQGYLKIPFNLGSTQVDLYNFSGHKINGPKGVGCIYIRKGTSVKPLHTGGGQESGMRSGTENVYGILGLNAAVAESAGDIVKRFQRMQEIRNQLVNQLINSVEDVSVNGVDASPYIISISALGVRGETLLHSLEGNGLLVGTGSACTSNKSGVSRVLTEMGLSDAVAEGTIRISFSLRDTFDKFDEFTDAYRSAVNKLRKFRRR